tara:strand:- start:212 stop:457 length:246 start_codon:yes stop_codon:yes gene_type:complete
MDYETPDSIASEIKRLLVLIKNKNLIDFPRQEFDFYYEIGNIPACVTLTLEIRTPHLIEISTDSEKHNENNVIHIKDYKGD